MVNLICRKMAKYVATYSLYYIGSAMEKTMGLGLAGPRFAYDQD